MKRLLLLALAALASMFFNSPVFARTVSAPATKITISTISGQVVVNKNGELSAELQITNKGTADLTDTQLGYILSTSSNDVTTPLTQGKAQVLPVIKAGSSVDSTLAFLLPTALPQTNLQIDIYLLAKDGSVITSQTSIVNSTFKTIGGLLVTSSQPIATLANGTYSVSATLVNSGPTLMVKPSLLYTNSTSLFAAPSSHTDQDIFTIAKGATKQVSYVVDKSKGARVLLQLAVTGSSPAATIVTQFSYPTTILPNTNVSSQSKIRTYAIYGAYGLGGIIVLGSVFLLYRSRRKVAISTPIVMLIGLMLAQLFGAPIVKAGPGDDSNNDPGTVTQAFYSDYDPASSTGYLNNNDSGVYVLHWQHDYYEDTDGTPICADFSGPNFKCLRGEGADFNVSGSNLIPCSQSTFFNSPYFQTTFNPTPNTFLQQFNVGTHGTISGQTPTDDTSQYGYVSNGLGNTSTLVVCTKPGTLSVNMTGTIWYAVSTCEPKIRIKCVFDIAEGDSISYSQQNFTTIVNAGAQPVPKLSFFATDSTPGSDPANPGPGDTNDQLNVSASGTATYTVVNGVTYPTTAQIPITLTNPAPGTSTTFTARACNPVTGLPDLCTPDQQLIVTRQALSLSLTASPSDVWEGDPYQLLWQTTGSLQPTNLIISNKSMNSAAAKNFIQGDFVNGVYSSRLNPGSGTSSSDPIANSLTYPNTNNITATNSLFGIVSTAQNSATAIVYLTIHTPPAPNISTTSPQVSTSGTFPTNTPIQLVTYGTSYVNDPAVTSTISLIYSTDGGKTFPISNSIPIAQPTGTALYPTTTSPSSTSFTPPQEGTYDFRLTQTATLGTTNISKSSFQDFPLTVTSKKLNYSLSIFPNGNINGGDSFTLTATPQAGSTFADSVSFTCFSGDQSHNVQADPTTGVAVSPSCTAPQNTTANIKTIMSTAVATSSITSPATQTSYAYPTIAVVNQTIQAITAQTTSYFCSGD